MTAVQLDEGWAMPASMLARLSRLCGRHGADPARFGLPLIDERPGEVETVPLRILLARTDGVARGTGWTDLGVQLALEASTADFDATAGALATSATLGRGLAGVLRLAGLPGPEPVPRGARVTVRLPARPGAAVLAEWLLADTVTAIRHFLVRPIAPVSVGLPHVPDGAAFGQLLGCPIVTGADATWVELSATDLARPMPERSPRLHQVFVERARRPHPRTRSARADVEDAIRALLPRGGATAAAVARHVAMSERRMQRALSEEGVGFRALLEAEQRQRALRALRAGATVEEAAERAGYTQVRSFRRAFRRWTGSSPADWRER